MVLLGVSANRPAQDKGHNMRPSAITTWALLGIAVVVPLSMLPISPGLAQGPSRPLRIIAPLAAGSTFDLQARVLGARFEERTRQPAIVENRPGANMGLAANACRAAVPDGQTICLFTHNLFLNPLLKAKLNYDPISDFEPIAIISYLEQVFVASRRVPADSFAKLVQHSKHNPDKLNYGSVGVGSAAHLVTEWLRAKSGGDWKHVPFNGSPQVQAALAAGDIHMTFTPTGNVIGRIASGDLRALLTAGEKRNPLLPDVPTFEQAGLPALNARSWSGLFAPKGTPVEIVERLHRTYSQIAQDMSFRKQMLAKLGLTPADMNREAFKDFIRADKEAWEPLVRQVGLYRN
jgi:tripartite-type tricarboxylate transporter receptor subunit TctC